MAVTYCYNFRFSGAKFNEHLLQNFSKSFLYNSEEIFCLFACLEFIMFPGDQRCGRRYGDNGSQPAISCSKLTIETLEQCVKYVQG